MNIRVVTESRLIDCISAAELSSALKHLQMLTKQESQHKENTHHNDANEDLRINDISFSQDKTLPRSSSQQRGESSLSFQLYQSKRKEEAKAQITARKRINQTVIQEIHEVKVNAKSEEIIKEKETRGEKWLPIHLRTQQNLQKKKQKIEDMRSKLQNKDDDGIRECTFKPKLNPITSEHAARIRENAKTRKVDSAHNNCATKGKNKENVIVSSKEIEDVFVQKKARSKTPTKQENSKSTLRIKTEERMGDVGGRVGDANPRPKNRSFNMLLDLIK